MWKYYFYHQWQYEKAEAYLCNMEEKGYRLIKIKFSHFFKFKKCSPKKAKYIFFYHFVKDYSMGYFDMLQYICGVCEGNKICGKKQFEPTVFRITDIKSNLIPIISYRNSYLKRIFKIKLLLALFFLIPIFFVMVATNDFFSNGRGHILLLIGILSGLAFLYYLVGLITLNKKSRMKTEEEDM